MIIREIQKSDNPKIEQVIKAAFPEFGLPLEGSTYEDPETMQMYESYQGARDKYFVIIENDELVGGGGIKPINTSNGSICELQKMYFSPKVRGRGYGKQLFHKCMETAKELGFEQCYLESASQLKTAIHIYETNGFKYLNKPLGNTGHYACGVWMIKDLI